MNVNILIVPGLNGSRQEHWQTHWQRDLPNCNRVIQRDWDHPELVDWLSALCEAVERSDPPILIIAHSLGCALVAYFGTTSLANKVGGAFLVSPVDVDLIKQDSELSQLLGSFTSMPKKPLPFKSVVVASSNDPYSTIDKSLNLAKAWEASFVNVGEQGHINIASGHGPWPEGRRLLKSFFPTFVP